MSFAHSNNIKKIWSCERQNKGTVTKPQVTYMRALVSKLLQYKLGEFALLKFLTRTFSDVTVYYFINAKY